MHISSSALFQPALKPVWWTLRVLSHPRVIPGHTQATLNVCGPSQHPRECWLRCSSHTSMSMAGEALAWSITSPSMMSTMESELRLQREHTFSTALPVKFLPLFRFQKERRGSKGNTLFPIWAVTYGILCPIQYTMFQHNPSSKLTSELHYSTQPMDKTHKFTCLHACLLACMHVCAANINTQFLL